MFLKKLKWDETHWKTSFFALNIGVLYANSLHHTLQISDSSALKGGMLLNMVSLEYPEHLTAPIFYF